MSLPAAMSRAPSPEGGFAEARGADRLIGGRPEHRAVTAADEC
jgi:hypothetical protein